MSRFNRHGCSMPPSAADHFCMSLEIDGTLPLDADALVAEVIASAESCHDSPKTTVWVDVVRGDVPAGLVDALSKLGGYGVGVVITHEASMACSHSPGPLLPKPLRDAVAAINRSGQVWHPTAQRLVAA